MEIVTLEKSRFVLHFLILQNNVTSFYLLIDLWLRFEKFLILDVMYMYFNQFY